MERKTLARAWDIQQRTTSDDWRDWMRTFALTLLKESPSAALRYCSVIAERSLLCYRENGAIRLQRRLDYTPCCCAAYPSLSQEACTAGGRWRRHFFGDSAPIAPWGALAAWARPQHPHRLGSPDAAETVAGEGPQNERCPLSNAQAGAPEHHLLVGTHTRRLKNAPPCPP